MRPNDTKNRRCREEQIRERAENTPAEMSLSIEFFARPPRRFPVPAANPNLIQGIVNLTRLLHFFRARFEVSHRPRAALTKFRINLFIFSDEPARPRIPPAFLNLLS